MKKQKQAFTLTELIVVIIVLSILSTIGFVSYGGYLSSVRDTTRMSSLKAIGDLLELYKTKDSLPLPDDYVDIQANGELIAYQGTVGEETLQTIEYNNGGIDPKDGTYYSYYLTKDRKYYQLMGFIEDLDNLETLQNSITPILTDGGTYPKVYGKKLGLLTDLQGIPINKVSSIKSAGFIDVATTTDEYNTYLKDKEFATGTGGVLYKLEELASVGGKYCKSDDNYIYCTKPLSVLPGNVMGFWDFENSYTDSSSLLNTGIIKGDTTIENSIYNSGRGNYISFDGNGDYLEIPNNTEYNLDNGTISFWVYLNDVSYQQGIFSRDAQGLLAPGHITYFIDTDGRLKSRLQNTSGSNFLYSDTIVSANTWVHLVGTFGTNGYKLYINGILEATDTYTGGISGNDNPIAIGCSTEISATNLTTPITLCSTAHMDNIAIYDKALEASEVLELYNSQK